MPQSNRLLLTGPGGAAKGNLTTVAAAPKPARQRIGVDLTYKAINLIRRRLQQAYGSAVIPKVIGEPVTYEDACALAASDAYLFQWWALGLVGTRPSEQKKGADRGIDGRLYFHERPKAPTSQIIFSVKVGKVDVAHVRDFRGVIERVKAQIGVLQPYATEKRPGNRPCECDH